MALASKRSILGGIKKRATKTIKAPNWGEVRIRKLSAKDMLEVQGDKPDRMVGKEAALFMCGLIVRSVVDPKGKPMFEVEDAGQLIESQWEDIQAVGNEVMEFNGLGAKLAKKK